MIHRLTDWLIDRYNKAHHSRVILLDNLVMIRSCLSRFCAANSC